MYFPYLRGKQYELIVLREMAEAIVNNGKVIPVIEPVKENFNSLKKTLEELVKFKAPFIIIVNPQVGALKQLGHKIKTEIIRGQLKDYSNYFVGYILSNTTIPSAVDDALDNWKNNQVALIHMQNCAAANHILESAMRYNNVKHNLFMERQTSQAYKDTFSTFENVIMRDGFITRSNREHPEDEYFSDIHLTYVSSGYIGFGDFLIIGEGYSDTGGPAFAVAIHITYFSDNDEMGIKHFISDTNDTPVNPGGKFFEALTKFNDFINANNSDFFGNTSAVKEFQDLYRREHYPGLGYIKKLSMKHHIELMMSKS